MVVVDMKILTDLCGYCGACIAVCPHNALELLEGTVEFEGSTNKIGNCQECGFCIIVCPLGVFIPEVSE